jgi:hypothetical protein
MDSRDSRIAVGRRAANLLIAVGAIACALVIVGTLLVRGAVPELPTPIETILLELRAGSGLGLLGAAIALVLVAPPCAMLIASVEIKQTYPRAVWLALSTTTVLGLSIVLAVLL